jgi:hypothetical protein
MISAAAMMMTLGIISANFTLSMVSVSDCGFTYLFGVHLNIGRRLRHFSSFRHLMIFEIINYNSISPSIFNVFPFTNTITV